MSRTWVRVVVAVVSLAALAGGLWAVGTGWDLRELHTDTLAARATGTAKPAEVVALRTIGGVDVAVVRLRAGGMEMDRRAILPANGPRAGDAVHVRVVTSLGASQDPRTPLFATTLVGGPDAAELERVRHRAGILLWSGFTTAIVAAFVASVALYLLWPEPKKQTVPHADRAGS